MDDLTGIPDWQRLPWPTHTDRLTLRPASIDDADAMFDYRSLASVAHWMTKLPTEVEAWRADFDKRYPYALMISLDGEPVGDLQGHGYASEAVRELLTIAFDGLGIRRVVANCFAGNEPSWRLMERVGLRREAHHVLDTLHRDGEWYDGLTYALLADEWRAR